MSEAHSISVEQNKPMRLELLRAQRLYYARAKLCAGSFALAAILLPFVGAFLGPKFDGLQPYVGIASIVLLILEVTFFLPMQRRDCRYAARIQEQFDTEVLGLDWNSLVAGSKVPAEDIRAIADGPMVEDERRLFQNWYESSISRLPLSVGRLLCQRTNIQYDSRVRNRYKGALLAGAALVFLMPFFVGLYQELTLGEAILNLVLPSLPLLTYLLREWRKQSDTLEELEALKTEVLKLWGTALAGESPAKLTVSARALQDAIFLHRATNPIVFEWFYGWLREGNEALTSDAVAGIVLEAEEKLNLQPKS